MRGRFAILAVALVALAAVVVVLSTGGGGGGKNALKELQAKHPVHKLPPIPGAPSVSVVAPRNGSRQTSGAVVVHVVVNNFRLSPGQFGREPELDEGNIRYQLHRVPNCISLVQLHQALKDPFSSGRVLGLSFDYPRYSGPNGVLAERLGVAGRYSPGTRPVIYYHHLPPGFYHIVINLANNNGTMTAFHGVTNFEILPPPGQSASVQCKRGTLPSSRAAKALE
ncbi:MAG: hypothetical protein WB507_02875 [Solirubrobacterales bacterium]